MSSTSSAAANSARRHSPPGPRGWPHFGCLNGLLKNPMAFWSGITNRYGGIALVPLKGRRPVYLISDPKMLYELLVTKRTRYRKNTRYKAAVDTFGAGLLLNEGDAWKRQRLMTQPTFKLDYIGSQTETMAGLAREYLAAWEPISDSGIAHDVDHDFLRLSQRIAGQYLMGPGFADIEADFGEAAEAIKNHWPLPPRSVLKLLLQRTAGRERKLNAAIAAMDACLLDFLSRQRARQFSDCGVLEVLANSSAAQGDAWDDKALRDQLLTLFFAGHETSATSLSWIHYLLSENPDVRARLQQEVHSVLGARREITAADVPALQYTEQVVNESLRLYSPIHSISRVALEDDMIGGYAIPAGAMIYVSLYAIHRWAELWPDPDRFDPERFAPERMAKLERFAFIPYAAGHRNCIGAAMATAELKIVLATIARRFTLDHDPSHRIEPTAGTTMYPRGGMPMFIRKNRLT